MSNNNQSVIHEFDFSLIGEFFKQVDRQGPGSEEVTKLALQLTGINNRELTIADIGCGTGGQTLYLAKYTQSKIEALDLMPQFVEKLRDKVSRSEYASRIHVIESTMLDLPFEKESLDLIWSEGAIYNIGYKEGLNEWRELLKPEGVIAVSEASWFIENPPGEIYDFWNANYPEIDTISNKVRIMEEAGYKVLATFILPEECWWNYFKALMGSIPGFLENHPLDKQAKKLTEMAKVEVELYRKYKDYYGYVFYIGQKLKD